MAIGFGNYGAGFGLSGGTTTTQSWTNTAGNLVVLGIDLNTSTVTVSSVTYGGQTMTAHPSGYSDVSGYRGAVFYLIGAPTGANDFVITLSSALGGAAVPCSYTGVGTGSSIDAYSKATSASTTDLSGTVTTVADNCWVIGFYRNGVGGTSAGSGTTARGVSENLNWLDTNTAVTPAGSRTIHGTWTPAGFGYTLTMSFSPTDVTPPSTGNFFALM